MGNTKDNGLKIAGVDFYAEKTSGHKHAALAGTVLMVSRTVFNGEQPKAVGSPKGQPDGVPCAMWVALEHLAKRCVKVTEAEARKIQPSLFAAIERFERSPEYREMHAAEIARAFTAGTYTIAPADDRVLARLPGFRVARETATGWTH